jgi:hypothetical protein
MNTAGRLLTWKELQLAIENEQGTVIGECLSPTGPFRLWWTPEDIPALSPHKCDREKVWGWPEPEFLPFFEWSYAKYTSPQSGLARLVCVPDEEEKGLMKKLSGVRFVSTCSFMSLREKL